MSQEVNDKGGCMRKGQIPVLLSVGLAAAVLLLGCEGPTGPAGKDGNANVTLYVFGSQDFSSDADVNHTVPNVTEAEWKESAWLFYLVNAQETPFPVPGPGSGSGDEYNAWTWLSTATSPPEVMAHFELESGTGESYTELRVVQIEASTVVQTTSGKGSTKVVIPEHLDTEDYNAVAEYYGLDR
jgi:hypothetical protein